MKSDLFGPVATKPRRVLMRAIDAGEFPDGKSCGHFKCRKCERETGFIYASHDEIRRGVPCDDCNARLPTNQGDDNA